MSGNVIAFLTALVLGGVAFVLGLQSTKQTSVNKQWLVLFIWTLSVFLAVNTFFALNGWRSLRALTTSPAITNGRDWSGAPVGEGVILIGAVSVENEVLRAGDIVAYFECGQPCYLFAPSPLMIDLQGSKVGISNRDFQERDWVYERGLNYSYYNLEINDPVVVIGQRVSDLFQAEVVYRGDYGNFLAHTRGKMNLAMAMVWLNAISSATFIGVGFAYWDRSTSQTESASKPRKTAK